jgi:DNA-binding beta-propeller fold protein YncE
VRIPVRIALGMVAVGAFAVVGVAPASPDVVWTPPQPEQVMGTASAPALAAWGLAVNPVSDEVIVGDYVSAQVRRFSPSGTYLGDFKNPNGTLGGVASALAVDPRNGDVYLAVTGEGRTSKSLRKYDAQGNFLFEVNLQGSVTWIAVDPEGYVWQPGAFAGARLNKWRINDSTKTATQVLAVTAAGTGPGQLGRLTGVTTDAAGNVYVADVGNHTVHSYTSTGQWRFDIGSASVFPSDIRGLVVDDDAGRLYVANSQRGTIEVFDLAGAHQSSFGGLGTGTGQFSDGARQLALTAGGNLLAADYGNRRVIEFTPAGGYVSHFPNPALPPDPAGFSGPRGIAVDPVTSDVLVTDTWGQRVQRFAPDGTLLKVFGRRGSTPPEGMNYPKSIAVDPTNRNVWVGNYEGEPDIVIFNSDFTQVVRRIPTLRFVHDIEIVGDSVYVVFRGTGGSHGNINVYNRTTGAQVSTCCNTFGQIRGIGVDTATGNMWITNNSAAWLYVISPSGAFLRQIPMDGRGWGVAIAGDVVYVADAAANKVIAFDRLTYERVGTFGAAGNAFGQLRSPSGLTLGPDGRIYVIEERGARVQVFGFGAAPAPETTKPTLAWTSPPAVSGSQVIATGTAADASGIGTVEVQVKDNTTGLYYNARTNVWAAANWSPAVHWGPITDRSWRFTTVLTFPGRTYTVRLRATDRLGNVSSVITRTFTVT